MTNQARVNLPVVIFDGDDTLWETERLYDDARDAAKLIVVRSGLDGDAWEALQKRIDVDNVKLYGLSKVRFPLSCVEAYEEMARRMGRVIDESVAASVRAAAESVFAAPAQVFPGAVDALQALRLERRLVLLTQGDSEVQWQRIRTSGMESLFDRIEVVPTKSDEVLKTLLLELKTDLASAWLVGNSLPSDINPARRCGLRAIWVEGHVWEYERRESEQHEDGVWRAVSVSEAASIISAGGKANEACEQRG
jgi:putative hydrolase of the HAD superfamily